MDIRDISTSQKATVPQDCVPPGWIDTLDITGLRLPLNATADFGEVLIQKFGIGSFDPWPAADSDAVHQLQSIGDVPVT